MRTRRPEQDGDDGTSLIELVVAMALLGLFSAMFLVAIVQLNPAVTKQQGIASSTDAARAAFTLLDKQFPYADGVNDPGADGSGTACTATSSCFVEYRWRQATSTGETSRCSQWVFDGTVKALREREWPDSGGSPGAWTTVATGVAGVRDPVSGVVQPVFSTPHTTGQVTTDLQAQQLTLAFSVTTAKGRSATEATLTAGNTTSPSAPTPAVCGRATSRTL